MRAALLFAGTLALPACGEAPALVVADVPFPATALLGLSDDQVERLVAVTALGVAQVRGELDALGREPIARGTEDLTIQALRVEVALENAGIGEDLLRGIYETGPEPELVVRHLVILSEEWRPESERQAARRRAQAGLDRIRAGEPFERVAAEVSEEPGAGPRGGLLEPGRAGTWVSEFWEAANRLAPGEVSEVVETPYGFHVLRLDERRAVPFEEGRARLAARVAASVEDPARWEALVRRWMEDDANRMDGPVPTGEALRRRALLAEAARRGVRPDPAEVARVQREWVDLAAGWASALGFAPGMGPEEIAGVAVRALGRTDQTARIVREAIVPHTAALLAAYPVERPPR